MCWAEQDAQRPPQHTRLEYVTSITTVQGVSLIALLTMRLTTTSSSSTPALVLAVAASSTRCHPPANAGARSGNILWQWVENAPHTKQHHTSSAARRGTQRPPAPAAAPVAQGSAAQHTSAAPAARRQPPSSAAQAWKRPRPHLSYPLPGGLQAAPCSLADRTPGVRAVGHTRAWALVALSHWPSRQSPCCGAATWTAAAGAGQRTARSTPEQLSPPTCAYGAASACTWW